MFRKSAEVACRLGACRPILTSWFGSGVSLRFDRYCRKILKPVRQSPASASNFSDRSPNRIRFNVSTIARSLSFSSRNSVIIPIRMSGSRGRAAIADAISRIYRGVLPFC